MIGLQGAGKSTFFRAHFAATHDLVSKDLISNNRQPARRQLQLVEEALQAGHSVVVDNTNPTPANRAELIQLAHAYGATISGYYFEPQVSRCLARNRQRNGKERVPDVAIFATKKRLVPPTYAEGFTQLFYVVNNDDGTFAASYVPEEEAGSNATE
ncbi:MAG TPA: ATP-binding protein [Ktedonobacteraceae bacterium]|nr:ATP-binding protein [Ktedonobacteraceae bacterium]